MIASALPTVLLLVCCTGKKGTSAENFDKEVYSPRYADGYEILGADGYESVIIRTGIPWQGGEGKSTSLFISRNGEEPPADFDGQVIDKIPERIVVMSSSYIAMLDALGKVETVSGVSGKQFVSNEYVRDNSSKIFDVGYDGNFNYEALVAAAPDLVMLYGVNGASSMEAKLKELGLPFVYVSEYIEEDPLGKTEWIVPFAEIMGEREKGEHIFDSIAANYTGLKDMVASVDSRPAVMVNTPYGDSWFMPSAKSYATRLISDAGGEYVYKKNNTTSSVPIDMEEAYLLTSGADVWISVGRLQKLGDLKAQLPRFSELPVVKSGKVFNSTLRVTPEGGNDYWESGVVHPDVVLTDLIKIFHPDSLADKDFYYYEQLK